MRLHIYWCSQCKHIVAVLNKQDLPILCGCREPDWREVRIVKCYGTSESDFQIYMEEEWE